MYYSKTNPAILPLFFSLLWNIVYHKTRDGVRQLQTLWICRFHSRLWLQQFCLHRRENLCVPRTPGCRCESLRRHRVPTFETKWWGKRLEASVILGEKPLNFYNFIFQRTKTLQQHATVFLIFILSKSVLFIVLLVGFYVVAHLH